MRGRASSGMVGRPAAATQVHELAIWQLVSQLHNHPERIR